MEEKSYGGYEAKDYSFSGFTDKNYVYERNDGERYYVFGSEDDLDFGESDSLSK